MDTGADALALEESKKHFTIDIADVAELVDGRMALFGNVDAIGLMESSSDADLQAEIARQCEAGVRNGRRFVLCTGSPITPRTPLARVRTYTDMAHAWPNN
jgi:uroporphyrinogen-III decarboxylase